MSSCSRAIPLIVVFHLYFVCVREMLFSLDASFATQREPCGTTFDVLATVLEALINFVVDFISLSSQTAKKKPQEVCLHKKESVTTICYGGD